MPCFVGIKYDNTPLASEAEGEDSKAEEFLHENHSILSHTVHGPYGASLRFSLAYNISLTTQQRGFIPTGVEILCLIYYSRKIHTGFSILSTMSSDTVLQKKCPEAFS